MKSLKPIEPDELRSLSLKYGAPQRVVLRLETSPILGGKHSDRRRGEVVMAIRLRNGKVLLHTKSFYPDGVFRLPSGGIHRDESVAAALFREVAEETGLRVDAARFIALIEYEIDQKREPFASYVFLLDTNDRKPTVQDPEERISAFKAVTASGLRAVALQLRSLPDAWRSWGEFRVSAHEWVAEALDQTVRRR